MRKQIEKGSPAAGSAAESQCLLRIERLLTSLVRSSLAEPLRQIASDKRLSQLYELTGKATVREISRKTGFSLGTISRTWQGWEMRGLILKDGAHYRRLV
jgi:hypothetical protein